jgi:hypothetical protein
MLGTATVVLPGGLLTHGVRHRQAVVRPLRGLDEEWLHGLPPQAPQGPVVTLLLGRRVERIGPVKASPALVRQLTPADRDALVWELRRRTFGERVDLVLDCPHHDCGATMDVDFDADALPVGSSTPPDHVVVAWKGGEVRARMPLVSDLDDIAEADDHSRLRLLRARCLAAGGHDDVQAFLDTEDLWQRLEAEMERRAPQLEHEIEAVCPTCGRDFTTAFSPVQSLLAEVLRRRSELEHDIHLLSLHYHWPLHEILRLARPRRRRYVGLLLDRLDRLASAAAHL